MRSVIVLLLLVGTAQAQPTSATAVVDNLIVDLLAKRFDAAAKNLAKQVTVRNIGFHGACKKSFPKDTAPGGAALAKCLASEVPWPDGRVVGSELKTPLGWRVAYGGLTINVRRTRNGYEVFSISLAGSP
jgi:hypothetical protein